MKVVKGCLVVVMGVFVLWLVLALLSVTFEVLASAGAVGGLIGALAVGGVVVVGLVRVAWPLLRPQLENVKQFALMVVLFHGAGFLAVRVVQVLLAALGREGDLGWFPFLIFVVLTAGLMALGYGGYRTYREKRVQRELREIQLRSLMGDPNYAWKMAVAANPDLVSRVMRNYGQVVERAMTQLIEVAEAGGRQVAETGRLLREVEAANPVGSLAPLGDTNRQAVEEAMRMHHGRIVGALSRMAMVGPTERRQLEAEVASLLRQLPLPLQ